MLEKHVEIKPIPSMIVAEKDAVLRIRRVIVDRQHVEVVGQIEARHREAQRILRGDLEVSHQPRIGGEKVGEASGIAVRNADVVLQHVVSGIRETAAVFHYGLHLQFPERDLHVSPYQEAVGQIGRQVGEDHWTELRNREIAEVGIETVQGSFGAAVRVGEDQLLSTAPGKLGGDFELPVARISVAVQYDFVGGSQEVRLEGDQSHRVVIG